MPNEFGWARRFGAEGRQGVRSGIVLAALQRVASWQLRSALAIVGIAVGAAAVIGVLNVAHNAKLTMRSQVLNLGTDLFSVTLRTQGGPTTFIPRELISQLPLREKGVRSAIPIYQSSGIVEKGGSPIPVVLLAATEGLMAISGAELQTGRLGNDLDGDRTVAVLGADVALRMSEIDGGKAHIGTQINIDGRLFEVVGILRPTQPSAILGFHLDSAVIISEAALAALIPDQGIQSYVGRINTGPSQKMIIERVADLTSRALPDGTLVQADAAWQLLDSLDEQLIIYDHLILGVGGIALLVGGVGIMNVMLMNVAERRLEIGIKLAVGARPSDIRLEFFVEALFMAFVGSMLGAMLGTLCGWGYSTMLGWTFYPAPAAIPMGLALAVLFAVFFGSYPAQRAAALTPIDALRSVA